MTNGQNGQNGQKKKLETQLWNIADSLRGKMNADEFRDYCLGFIFYKYLSERQHLYANEILAEDEIDFLKLDESSEDGKEYLAAIAEESITELGYFLKPAENDFNLNIPRYVDTFEEEEEIDLAAVALELRQVDRDMEETDRLIRGFCNELGILQILKI